MSDAYRVSGLLLYLQSRGENSRGRTGLINRKAARGFAVEAQVHLNRDQGVGREGEGEREGKGQARSASEWQCVRVG